MSNIIKYLGLLVMLLVLAPNNTFAGLGGMVEHAAEGTVNVVEEAAETTGEVMEEAVDMVDGEEESHAEADHDDGEEKHGDSEKDAESEK